MRIEIKKIDKAYGDTRVFSGFSQEIEGGTSHAIIGPNGSGKSTLLRMASMLEQPDSGEINYFEDSNPVRCDLNLRRKIAIVLPGDTLFNSSVFNNVAFGLRVRRLPKGEIRERVLAILEMVQLSEKVYKPARTLSLGQAQRLLLARALVLKPKYLFLDEPTASLDPINMEIIETTLQETRSAGDTTIIMITHDLFQARRLADKVSLLVAGRVIEESTVKDFFENPQEELTKQFLNGRKIY